MTEHEFVPRENDPEHCAECGGPEGWPHGVTFDETDDTASMYLADDPEGPTLFSKEGDEQAPVWFRVAPGYIVGPLTVNDGDLTPVDVRVHNTYTFRLPDGTVLMSLGVEPEQ